jgi:hypothetical protein
MARITILVRGLIEVEGDKATCQVYLQLRHFVKHTETDILFGYYTFHMIRSGSGWKIALVC